MVSQDGMALGVHSPATPAPPRKGEEEEEGKRVANADRGDGPARERIGGSYGCVPARRNQIVLQKSVSQPFAQRSASPLHIPHEGRCRERVGRS